MSTAISDKIHFEHNINQAFASGGTFERLFVTGKTITKRQIDADTSYTYLFSHEFRPTIRARAIDESRYTKIVSMYHKDIDITPFSSNRAIDRFDSLPPEIRVRLLDIHEFLTGHRVGGFYEYMNSLQDYIDALRRELHEISYQARGENYYVDGINLDFYFDLLQYFNDQSLLEDEVYWGVVKMLIISFFKG